MEDSLTAFQRKVRERRAAWGRTQVGAVQGVLMPDEPEHGDFHVVSFDSFSVWNVRPNDLSDGKGGEPRLPFAMKQWLDNVDEMLPSYGIAPSAAYPAIFARALKDVFSRVQTEQVRVDLLLGLYVINASATKGTRARPGDKLAYNNLVTLLLHDSWVTNEPVADWQTYGAGTKVVDADDVDWLHLSEEGELEYVSGSPNVMNFSLVHVYNDDWRVTTQLIADVEERIRETRPGAIIVRRTGMFPAFGDGRSELVLAMDTVSHDVSGRVVHVGSFGDKAFHITAVDLAFLRCVYYVQLQYFKYQQGRMSNQRRIPSISLVNGVGLIPIRLVGNPRVMDLYRRTISGENILKSITLNFPPTFEYFLDLYVGGNI